jgi:hypothetical protein
MLLNLLCWNAADSRCTTKPVFSSGLVNHKVRKDILRLLGFKRLMRANTAETEYRRYVSPAFDTMYFPVISEQQTLTLTEQLELKPDFSASVKQLNQ